MITLTDVTPFIMLFNSNGLFLCKKGNHIFTSYIIHFDEQLWVDNIKDKTAILVEQLDEIYKINIKKEYEKPSTIKS